MRYLGWLLSGLLFATAGGVSAQISQVQQPVVYGFDDRVEVFEHPSVTMRDIGVASTVALVPRVVLSEQGGNVELLGPTLSDFVDLCEDEPFRDQTSSAECSGVLLSDNLVITAGHCVSDPLISPGGCDEYAYVFDYRMKNATELESIDTQDVYACSRVVARSETDALDYAIIQLEESVDSSRTPVALRPAAVPIVNGEPMTLIGSPVGIPIKIASGAVVADARTQQQDYLVAAVDAFRGHSGAGVYDDEGRLMGLLFAGAGPDYASDGTSSCKRANVLLESEPQERIVRAEVIRKALCDTGWQDEVLCPETTSSCVGSSCPPAQWFCSAELYGDGATCDCACGAVDPDCTLPELPVEGCPNGAMCDDQGECEGVPLDKAALSLEGTCALTTGSSPRVLGWALLCGALFAIRRRRREV